MPPPDPRKVFTLSSLLGKQSELNKIGAEILNGGPRAIRYRETRPSGKTMVFVARHDDVVSVLMNEDDFSLLHYGPLYAAVAPPGAFLVMRPEGPGRAERLAILRAAAARTPWFGSDPARRRELARACVDNVLAAVRRRRRFDLIGEYGYFVPYLVGKRVIGLPGPQAFGVLPRLVCAVNALPLGRAFTPETGSQLTQLVWSEVVLAQLLANFEDRNPLLRWAAAWGAMMMRALIERRIDAFPRAAGDDTLLSALWSVKDTDFPEVDNAVYREHVVSIMMELMATILLFPGMAFSGIVDRWAKPGGPGLEDSLHRLKSMDAEDFAQEELRLAPPSGHLLRNATGPVELGGLILKTGEYVCALVSAAGRDIAVEPGAVRAGRSLNTYLHFGPENGPHRCFAHRLAPAILAEMFLGIARLPELATRSGLFACMGLPPGRMMVDFGEPVGTAP